MLLREMFYKSCWD